MPSNKGPVRKKRMTVYVVAPDYSYEGLGEAEAVYTRETHAKAHKQPGTHFEITKLLVTWQSPKTSKRKRS